MERLLNKFLLAAQAAGFLIEAQGRYLGAGELLPTVDIEPLRDRFAEKGLFPGESFLFLCSACDGLKIKKPEAYFGSLVERFYLQKIDNIFIDIDIWRKAAEEFDVLVDFVPAFSEGDADNMIVSGGRPCDASVRFLYYDNLNSFQAHRTVFESLEEMFSCLILALERGIDPTPDELDNFEQAKKFIELCLDTLGERPYWRESYDLLFSKDD